ncbi:bifunctional aminoglycoside phosphotransferase/ATP-binding protein [Skermanella aerolata]|nr:bifunctional aminoglycoside phosphotransferase/ATP-binding protein [Skermanella aerolata]KJB96276.1 aminoglycoside phosphotransferase [Skermanella aerolata KACC 11604]
MMTGASSPADQAAIAAFLSDPATHGGDVERIDTHGSMVFLTGDRVYKLKRAVSFPYMDYGTREKRAAACEAEVKLNRRTAPSLYLGLAPVLRGAADGFRLGPLVQRAEGEAEDWLVVMARVDREALFDRMAESGRLDADLMRRLADAVAAFHASAERFTDRGGQAAMRWVVEDNVAELAERPDLFGPDRLARLADLSRVALDRHAGLLDLRRDGGLVRYCHGDLHLRNICLVDGQPTLFDCIEFNDDIAIVDVLYDQAFLLMDLEHRGLRSLANALFNRMLERTGDIGGLVLLPLFLSTRAAVRAKVEASAGKDRSAREYFDHALTAIDPPGPKLVAVGGLSGSGKTTVARMLAPDIGPAPGAVVLRSDAVRKELWGVAETDRLPPEAYAPDMTHRVYAELADRARRIVSAGHGVVVDAVHARIGERAALEDLARRLGVPFRGIWLEAPPEVLIARVEARTGDASDAGESVVRRQLTYALGEISWPRVVHLDGDEDSKSKLRQIIS